MYLRSFLKKILSFNVYFILMIVCLILLLIHKPETNIRAIRTSVINDRIVDVTNRNSVESYHSEIITSYYEKRKHWHTSNLGSVLFQNIPRQKAIESHSNTDDNKFLVLIWKYWKWLENRHVRNFNNKQNNNTLSGCSVNNCVFTGDDNKLSTADAVIIHIQRGIFPNVTQRNQRQRWVFLNDESPVNAFSMARYQPKISDLANIFNWSMTYRSDSDVPVPYGRTVPLQKPIVETMSYENMITLVPNWKNKRRDVLVTILISNCGVSRRMNYLNQLQKHVAVDVFGRCSKDHKESCPGHFRSDCNIMSGYLFYLVFENSECEEYLTEKSFYNAYSKGAIPVILGPTLDSCKLLLPPNSFLHINNYKSPEELAKHIIEISKDDNKLLSYHRWRNDFEVVNEHGYFGSKSYHLCRICEALNYNDQSKKVYTEENLRKYFDPKYSCR